MIIIEDNNNDNQSLYSGKGHIDGVGYGFGDGSGDIHGSGNEIGHGYNNEIRLQF